MRTLLVEVNPVSITRDSVGEHDDDSSRLLTIIDVAVMGTVSIPTCLTLDAYDN